MTNGMANGNEILEWLDSVLELEWGKCVPRKLDLSIPNMPRNGDQSNYPPFTSFRLKSDNPEFMKKLMDALESYEGEVEWTLKKHDRTPLKGTNWCIAPKVVIETQQEPNLDVDLNAQEYFQKYKPEFGLVAYRDMLGLVKHLQFSLKL